MKRNLLTIALCVMSVLVASADYQVDDVVQTPTQTFIIQGENLIQNGDFSYGDLSEWLGIADADYSGEDKLKITYDVGPEGAAVLEAVAENGTKTDGIFQSVAVATGWNVVVFQVSNANTGCYTNYTRFDDGNHGLSSTNANFMNAFFSVDKPEYCSDANVYYVSDGGAAIEGMTGFGYEFTYPMGEYKTVVYAFNAEQDGYITVEFSALTPGTRIANVGVYAAQEVSDLRAAQRYLAYVTYIIEGYDWPEGTEKLTDVQYYMNTLEQAINNKEYDKVPTQKENLETMMAAFCEANLSNMLDNIYKDGVKGVYTANWDTWDYTSSVNKLNQTNTRTWQWNTDRWCMKDVSESGGKPVGVNWQQGQTANWDNIATLTTKLDKGVYFWGFEGWAWHMPRQWNSWAKSTAKDCGRMYSAFNIGEGEEIVPDTVTDIMSPHYTKYYIKKYEIAEDATPVNIAIRTYPEIDGVNNSSWGYYAQFFRPTLYKVLVKGEITPEQKTYIEWTRAHYAGFRNKIDEAKTELADETKPWAKDALKDSIDYAENQYAGWADIVNSDEALISMYKQLEIMYDTIYQKGYVRINNALSGYKKGNAAITDIPPVIERAVATRDDRMNASGDKETLNTWINKVQGDYDNALVSTYSEELYNTLVKDKTDLEEAIVAFVASVVRTTKMSVDFNDAKVETVYKEDEQGQPTETVDYQYVAGSTGHKFIVGHANQLAWLGYNTDSLNTLRVGRGDQMTEKSVYVDFDATPSSDTNIMILSFDVFYGGLNNRGFGWFVYDNDSENTAMTGFADLSYNTYNGVTRAIGPTTNDFGGNCDMLNFLGAGFGNIRVSQTGGNAVTAQSSNRTTFTLVLDYGVGEYYATATTSKGTVTTNKFTLDKTKHLCRLGFSSDYNVEARYCWVDNLLLQEITAGAPSGGIKGDVNGDGVVDGTDIQEVINIMLAGTNDPVGDINKDGVVDGTDIQEIINIMLQN